LQPKRTNVNSKDPKISNEKGGSIISVENIASTIPTHKGGEVPGAEIVLSSFLEGF
jgi:hypothetical protein